MKVVYIILYSQNKNWQLALVESNIYKQELI